MQYLACYGGSDSGVGPRVTWISPKLDRISVSCFCSRHWLFFVGLENLYLSPNRGRCLHGGMLLVYFEDGFRIATVMKSTQTCFAGLHHRA